MLYFLIINLALWLATYLLHKAADRPGDDFASGILAVMVFCVAAVSSFVYVAIAVWLHRFV